MKFLLRLLLLLVLAALLFSAYSFYVWRTPVIAGDTTVMIERGTGARGILKQLHGEGLLPDPWKIVLPLVISGDVKKLKAGEYLLEEGMSAEMVLHKIAGGRVVIHSVTIPEGFTVAQVRAALMKEELLTGGLPAVIEEGSVMPDTQHYSRGDARADLLKRMQEQQAKVLDEVWAKRADNLPFTTKHEALTLASIIEEETGVDEERGRVAAVYVNRLRIGMLLQADPTVAYGIAPGGMTRMLTRRDLQRDTPYNTYTRAGLPPGPICNPGRASIEAAVNPPDTDELFFVATGTGGHYFAKTEKEHLANVARYRAQRTKTH